MRGLIPERNWKPVNISDLEPNADKAVKSSSNLLIVAGPGAGKTELLAQRANFLLETGTCNWPRRILAISFKRDAAKNLQDRVNERCGNKASRFDSLTLDAFAKGLVDRFLQAIPAEWRPNIDYQVRTNSVSFNDSLQWLKTASIPSGTPSIDSRNYTKAQLKRSFDKVTHGVQLPYDSEGVKQVLQDLGRQWWHEQLQLPPGEPSLTFPMLNRLAAYLLRCNPKIREALRYTYSAVFLDEFQDTTASQWDLVESAFVGSKCILTAVGDNKQRIMVWAGALEDVFDKFNERADATRLDLVRNYRSVPELVRIQQRIAEACIGEVDTPLVESRKEGDGICSILEFRDPEQEAVYFANLITQEVGAGVSQLRDYCVIVRQRTGDMVALLKEELRNRGISLRDESLLQDLRAEPITPLIVSLIKLATNKRDPEAWDVLCSSLVDLAVVDEADSTLDINAMTHIAQVRDFLENQSCLRGLPQVVVDVLGGSRFKSTYRQYSNGDYLNKVLDQLGIILDAEFEETGDISDVVDAIMGENVVPAMTIHKSKGLEFETIIFLGLEDGQWWNFRNQPEEEKRAFFVAFSRAKSRVIFSLSDLRDTKFGRKHQYKNEVGTLHEILYSAGVEIIDARSAH